MIDNRPAARQRRWWWTVFVAALVVMLVGGAALGRNWVREPGASPASSSSSLSSLSSASSFASVSPSAPPSVASSSSVAASVSVPPSEKLQVGGAVPVQGTGKFRYALGDGPVLGRSGTLRTFHVAVERGSGQDATAFAALVEATLGDSRSWIGGHAVRLQRVDLEKPAAFTVYLATRLTAGLMCERGGTNIRRGGVPYTSCRTTGAAIINLDRWEKSAPPYVSAKVPLAVYRQYVINHEVGHELGHHHEGCPAKGGPAPVMVQQTLSLLGCVPNAWPRPDRRPLFGPPV